MAMNDFRGNCHVHFDAARARRRRASPSSALPRLAPGHPRGHSPPWRANAVDPRDRRRDARLPHHRRHRLRSTDRRGIRRAAARLRHLCGGSACPRRRSSRAPAAERSDPGALVHVRPARRRVDARPCALVGATASVAALRLSLWPACVRRLPARDVAPTARAACPARFVPRARLRPARGAPRAADGARGLPAALARGGLRPKADRGGQRLAAGARPRGACAARCRRPRAARGAALRGCTASVSRQSARDCVTVPVDREGLDVGRSPPRRAVPRSRTSRRRTSFRPAS